MTTTAKTFTSTRTVSTHGNSKVATREEMRLTGHGSKETTYRVEHTGPRLFAVIATTTIESTPTPVSHIMSGEAIICHCGSAEWYYTGRSLFNLNYECASCESTISPVSETGACQ